jgi:hypothetical protein
MQIKSDREREIEHGGGGRGERREGGLTEKVARPVQTGLLLKYRTFTYNY